MFADSEVRVHTTHLIAVFLWVISVLVWGLAWLLDLYYVVGLAMLFVAGAVTMSIRGFFITQTEQMRVAMLVRASAESNGVRTLH